MAKARPILILFILFFAAQESRSEAPPYLDKLAKFSTTEPHDKHQENNYSGGRRLMIGSTAPRCTYNECRGCRFKCRAEQVPVEGNDPINSAYHYKCICHR